ncbi:hypothetical protein CKO44_14520 [Rubrivivax gelatinosus]|uniref:HTH marR-type domain-containing protein n=1 Tax=Rubrivivax gelatinosus TaxID=28068 RepID=A0ABS1DQF3_RUBGE|nr:MarR family transcriptional regulator [Rubrivivax gelatinosus]MBK1614685.1 hypothetical protein [Rubrivivax gelatinosus]MBK1712227.1 hypothetical protein [Rubrivivax gelatinosus]MBZ8143407.1 transcriptional regulator [Rubrivivax gelatinosus]
MSENDAAIERFIETHGLLAESDGLPRILGRMAAIFMLEPGPFSFSEIGERLQISRASVSTTTRLLENLGVLERIARPGDRQAYFRLVENPVQVFTQRRIARQQRCVEAVDDLLTKAVLDTEARARLEEIRGHHIEMLAASQATLDRRRSVA